ncbi:hypothetical protein LINPERPRIM_LOCUS9204 [Linum perenne]
MNPLPNCKKKLLTFAADAKALFFTSDFPNLKIIAVYTLSSFFTFFLGIAMVFEWAFHGRSYPGCRWTIYYAVSLIVLPLFCLLLCFLSSGVFRRRRPIRLPNPTTPNLQQEHEFVSMEEGGETSGVSSEQSVATDESRDQPNSESKEKEFIVCASCASRLVADDNQLSRKEEFSGEKEGEVGSSSVSKTGEVKSAIDDGKNLRTKDEFVFSPIKVNKKQEYSKLRTNDEFIVSPIEEGKSTTKKEEFTVSSSRFEKISSDLSQEEEIIVYLKGLSKRWDNVRCRHHGFSHTEEIPETGSVALFGVPKTGDSAIDTGASTRKEELIISTSSLGSNIAEVKSSVKEEGFVPLAPSSAAPDAAKITGNFAESGPNFSVKLNPDEDSIKFSSMFHAVEKSSPKEEFFVSEPVVVVVDAEKLGPKEEINETETAAANEAMDEIEDGVDDDKMNTRRSIIY